MFAAFDWRTCQMRTLVAALATAALMAVCFASAAADAPYTAQPGTDKSSRAVSEKPATVQSNSEKPVRAADAPKSSRAAAPKKKK
jgi:hypothetical protein